MLPRIYDPWIGTKMDEPGKTVGSGSRLLILSESAYRWATVEPGRDHPTVNTVKTWSLCEENWAKPGRHGKYARTLTRTLCRDKWPSLEQRTAAWDAVAYSIYVQRVLDQTTSRPTTVDIHASEAAFRETLELVKPRRIVVTSVTVWRGMPIFDVNGEDDTGAYRLRSGDLAWAMHVPHPNSRNPRYVPQEVATKIDEFCRLKLPSHVREL